MPRSKTLERKVQRILKNIDDYEAKCHSGDLTLSQLSDQIGWLWKFRHISEAEMHSMCHRMTALFELAKGGYIEYM